MDRRKCPGCGSWYNGKKCKECLFVLFEDEEKHDHPHGVYGEPSPFATAKTEKSTARPAVSTYFPPRQQKKSAGLLRKLIIFALIPAILSVISALFQLVTEVTDVVSDLISVDEETISVPEESHILYEGAGFYIAANWQPGESIDGDISLVMENNTGNTVTVSTSMAAVNGIMTDDVFFYCSAEAHSPEEATLWIDMDTLDALGIDVVETITLYVRAYDADSYDTIDPGTLLVMKTDDRSVRTPDFPTGTVLHSSDAFSLSYLGWEETESGEYALWFYGENRLDQMLSLSSSEIYADEAPLGAYLWQDFLPETKACFSVWGDDLSELDIDSLTEIETLKFSLLAEDTDSWEEIFSTDILQIACTP